MIIHRIHCRLLTEGQDSRVGFHIISPQGVKIFLTPKGTLTKTFFFLYSFFFFSFRQRHFKAKISNSACILDGINYPQRTLRHLSDSLWVNLQFAFSGELGVEVNCFLKLSIFISPQFHFPDWLCRMCLI